MTAMTATAAITLCAFATGREIERRCGGCVANIDPTLPLLWSGTKVPCRRRVKLTIGVMTATRCGMSTARAVQTSDAGRCVGYEGEPAMMAIMADYGNRGDSATGRNQLVRIICPDDHSAVP